VAVDPSGMGYVGGHAASVDFAVRRHQTQTRFSVTRIPACARLGEGGSEDYAHEVGVALS